MPSVTTPVTVNLSGSGSDPPTPVAPLVLPDALAVAEIVLVVAVPPAPSPLEALAAEVGSEEHAATTAPPRAATRTIEESARRITLPA